MVSIRIATLQLNPKIGCVSENIQRANTILSKTISSNIKAPDLLVLPELALTGYNFKSSNEISPYLESPSKPGAVLSWAKETSIKYNCFTILGYPQLHPSSKQILNSAIVFNHKGDIVHNYDKSFLYETDEVWGCVEGGGFQEFELKDGIKSSIGICMDLNPYKFEAPFNKFEFSGHCKANDIDLIICPMAWLHAKSPSILKEELTEDELSNTKRLYADQIKELDGKFEINVDNNNTISEYVKIEEFDQLQRPDFSNLNYWILRFFPFLNHVMKPFDRVRKKTTVIIANRSGIEDDILYGGTSSIFQFNGSHGIVGYDSIDLTNKSVDVLGALSKGKEGILIRDVEL